MSYGFMVPNTSSATDTPDQFRGGRVVHILSVRSWSGTATISNYDSTSGFFYVVMNSVSLQCPRLIWDNSTKVLTWSTGGGIPLNDANFSRNFEVLFFSTKALV